MPPPYQEPPWRGYPQTSPLPSPSVSGHESMSLGLLLGELRAGQGQIVSVLQAQMEVLRQIHGQLLSNAAAASAPKPDIRERLTWRDWAQIAMAALIVVGAIAGKIPLKDVPGLIGKPFGF